MTVGTSVGIWAAIIAAVVVGALAVLAPAPRGRRGGREAQE